MTERLLAFFEEFGEGFNLTPESEVEAAERALIYISLITQFDKEEISKEEIIAELIRLAEEAIDRTSIEVVEEQDENYEE